MRIQEPDTDYLSIDFEARGDPLAQGDAGLAPFFDALEAHAGEWMPEEINGRRRKRYSRTAALKELKMSVSSLGVRNADFYRASPFAKMWMRIENQPWPHQFLVSMSIYPLSLMDEPVRAERWRRQLIDLLRAWSSHYPVTHALVHGGADAFFSRRDCKSNIGPEQAPHEWLKAMFWLNVFGKGFVDTLGRERVLSAPAHLIEELPNGAVLIVTHPTVADWRSHEARRAQARALVHLRPDLDFDAALSVLRERSAKLEPVEQRFDPDSSPFFKRVVNRFSADEHWEKIRELNALQPPEVDEWLPARAAPPSDVANPSAAAAEYRGLADDLSILLHPDVPSLHEATPASLTDIDYRLWWEKFPDFYEREKIDHSLFPAVGAYLGEMLVRHLGGRWVPRRNVEESQVIVGDRAWLPYLRVRRYLRSTQALLDYSLTKFYRAVERERLLVSKPGS